MIRSRAGYRKSFVAAAVRFPLPQVVPANRLLRRDERHTVAAQSANMPAAIAKNHPTGFRGGMSQMLIV